MSNLKQFAEDYIKGYNSPLERAKITNFVDAWEDQEVKPLYGDGITSLKSILINNGEFEGGGAKRTYLDKKTTTNNKKK